MQILTDTPTINDLFYYTSYLKEFEDLFGSFTKLNTPMGVLIDGVSGVGKTSFLQMLDRRLGQSGMFRVVLVHAWRLENQDRLLVSLLHSMLRRFALDLEKEQFTELQGIVARIDETIRKSRAASGQQNGQPLEQPGEAVRIEQSVAEFLRKSVGTLSGMVLLLDGLEHCSPKVSVEIARLIKVFFLRQGVVVVTTTCTEQLAQSFERANLDLAEIQTPLGQIHFRLPLLAPSQMHAFLNSRLPKPVFGEFIPEILTVCHPTPRFLKRFINQMDLLQRFFPAKRAGAKTLLLLGALAVQFPEFPDILRIFGKKFLAGLGGYLTTPTEEFLLRLPPDVRAAVRRFATNEAFVHAFGPHLNFLLGKDPQHALYPEVVLGMETDLPQRHTADFSGIREEEDDFSDQGDSIFDEHDDDIAPSDLPDLGDSGIMEVEEDLFDDEPVAAAPIKAPIKAKPPLKPTPAPKLESVPATSRLTNHPSGMNLKAMSEDEAAGRVQTTTALNRDEVISRYKRGEGFDAANLSGVDLRDVDLKGINLAGCNLTGANFDRSNLRRANLKGCNLNDASFEGANLMDADLTGAAGENADFNGANLWGAHLEGTTLTRVNMRGTNLRAANLKKSDLFHANLMGAEFVDSNLTEANLTGIIVDQHTTFHFACINAALIEPKIREVIDKKYQPNEKQILMPRLPKG